MSFFKRLVIFYDDTLYETFKVVRASVRLDIENATMVDTQARIEASGGFSAGYYEGVLDGRAGKAGAAHGGVLPQKPKPSWKDHLLSFFLLHRADFVNQQCKYYQGLMVKEARQRPNYKLGYDTGYDVGFSGQEPRKLLVVIPTAKDPQ